MMYHFSRLSPNDRSPTYPKPWLWERTSLANVCMWAGSYEYGYGYGYGYGYEYLGSLLVQAPRYRNEALKVLHSTHSIPINCRLWRSLGSHPCPNAAERMGLPFRWVA